MDYLEVGSHDSIEVAELHKWKITGDFTSFQSPGKFQSFLKWLLYSDVTGDLSYH